MCTLPRSFRRPSPRLDGCDSHMYMTCLYALRIGLGGQIAFGIISVGVARRGRLFVVRARRVARRIAVAVQVVAVTFVPRAPARRSIRWRGRR